MDTVTDERVGYDELAVLKLLAVDGGLEGGTKTSCRSLAERLDASSQTASRRLRRLDEAGLLERDTVGDGQWVTVTGAGEAALREEYEDYRRVFEEARPLELVGTVTDGMGEGRHYITLPGYMEQFRSKLGYEPYPGTLNVTLTEAGVRGRGALSGRPSVRIEGWEDEDRTYGPADCYPATVAALEGEGDRSYEQAHAIVPERTHHDEDSLEVIAPERLREVLELSDDDPIAVRVDGGASR
jgi:riboflavin kinase